MNKIIIIALAILCTIGVVLIFVVLSKPASAPTIQNSNSYSVSITNFGPTLSASMTSNGKTTELSTDNYSQYATVSFNNPHDIMWVQCPAGFITSAPISTTNNPLINDPDLGPSITMSSSTQTSNLSITCTKK